MEDTTYAHFTAAPGEGDSSHTKLIGGKLRWHQAPRLLSSSRHQPTPGQLPLLRGAPQQLPGRLPARGNLHSSSAGHTLRAGGCPWAIPHGRQLHRARLQAPGAWQPSSPLSHGFAEQKPQQTVALLGGSALRPRLPRSCLAAARE